MIDRIGSGHYFHLLAQSIASSHKLMRKEHSGPL